MERCPFGCKGMIGPPSHRRIPREQWLEAHRRICPSAPPDKKKEDDE